MKNKKIKKITVFLSVIFIITAFSGFKFFDDGDDFEIAKSLDIFHTVVRDVRLFYVDKPDISQLIKESVDDFLKKLDPYTVFYPESEMEDYRFMATGAYGGIGALIKQTKTDLIVAEIYKNSPADTENLHEGDTVKSVNGNIITSKNIDDIKLLLKGEPGSDVQLEIKRYGINKPIKKTLKRKKIIFDNIQHYCMLDNNIAYISLGQFRRNASTDLQKAFENLKDSNDVKSLIIDLRNNPGGLLIESVRIVNLFVEKGSNIVSTKGKIKNRDKTYKANLEPIAPNIPIVILVNRMSASASEIVAGALQDLDRGIILGERTFGKGLVQTTRDLSYNTKMKITIAKYYIPSGRCIQAIDYSSRNTDGSVGKIPDSLMTEFKTLNGRSVYDGGGINPDIIIEPEIISPALLNSLQNNLIFNYATKYFYTHKSISKPEDFKINDEDYNDFIEFAKNEKINYNTESLDIVKELYKVADNEKYNKNILQKIKNLENELKRDIKNDFNNFREEISPYMEREIVLRYYYKKGKIRKSIKADRFLDKAKEILKNNEYEKILKTF